MALDHIIAFLGALALLILFFTAYNLALKELGNSRSKTILLIIFVISIGVFSQYA